jgi:archaellum biogenesis ATPase FlaH
MSRAFLQVRAEELVGGRTLIVGERGRGKTQLTAKLLEDIAGFYPLSEITAIDMAPTTLTPSSRLSQFTSLTERIRYLAPPVIRAPRIEARTREEVLELAEFNKRAIDTLLDEFLERPTKVLVVNDLTIYFHRGSASKVLRCVDKAETFLANAYMGGLLAGQDKGSGVSYREARELARFIKESSPRIIRL